MPINQHPATFIIENGTITALAGGPLSLADMGPRTTKRASTLEFNSIRNQWIVYSDENVEMFCHPDYDKALDWEREHFNTYLGGVT